MGKIQVTEKRSRYFSFKCRQGKKVIGRAFLFIIKNELHQKPYGLLEDLFVDEKYRGQGLGTMLVQQVIQKAKEAGCYKLLATSRFGRKEVHKFYKKLGFEKWGYEFRLDF
jgi:GNAT superfamily N-acetyltransferase